MVKLLFKSLYIIWGKKKSLGMMKISYQLCHRPEKYVREQKTYAGHTVYQIYIPHSTHPKTIKIQMESGIQL